MSSVYKEIVMHDTKKPAPEAAASRPVLDVSGQRWALLIGADFYMTGDARSDDTGHVVHYSNLEGCVNDVDLMEVLLEEEFAVPHDNIIKLTSSLPDEGSLNILGNETAFYPTYANIRSAFHQLRDKGKPGDLVYIHYSGHGARVRTAYVGLKGHEEFDEALVPVDIEIKSEGEQSRYIRDVELATWLDDLVDKDLRVTIVVDSCHAGSANRTGSGATARGTGVIDYALLPSDIEDTVLPAHAHLPSPADAPRNGMVQKNWLLEASGYTMLAACTAFQRAHEHEFSDKKNGALTYFLVEALRTSPPAFPVSMLLGKITAQIQSHFSDQTPLLDGEGNVSFFSAMRLPVIPEVRVSSIDLVRNTVHLDHGNLHGIHSGAEYTLADDAEPKGLALARIRVIRPMGLKSLASFMEPLGPGRKLVKPGFRAYLVKQAPEKQAVLRFAGYEPSAAQELPGWQSDFRLYMEQNHLHSSLWRLYDPSIEDCQAEDYTISVTDSNHYEIEGASQQPLPNLPAIRVGSTNAVAKLLQVITHIARFRVVERLEPDPVSCLRIPWRFELVGKSSKAPLQCRPQDWSKALIFPAGLDPVTLVDGAYSVSSKEIGSVIIENQGTIPIYVAVFNLKPLWGIRKVYPSSGSWSECIGPGQKRNLRIQMSIPTELLQADVTETTETLKAIATLHPTPLGVLEMDNISESSLRTSSDFDYKSNLDSLLESLVSPNRTIKMQGNSSGGWQTCSIMIRTSCTSHLGEQ